MFTGLLYKFNELNFPDSVKISVSEMLSLSGISDVRTFRNARNKLTNYLHTKDDTESWVVKYTEGDIKEYGDYELNYVILLEYYSNVAVDLQESYSKKSRLRSKIDPYVDPKSAKNALPSNTIQEDTKKDKIRIGSVDEQSLNDKDDSDPTYSQNERAIINAINKKCGTTWDGGMGTPNYAILQEIATYSIVVVQQGIDRLRPEQKPPGMLSYLRKVIINGLDDGSISDDFQPAMKDPYKENPYLYARDRFYSMMSRDQLDWEGFQKDGKLRYMASASLGFVETARDALKNEQLLGEVIEKHPIMLEVLADIEKTAQEVYDAEPR